MFTTKYDSLGSDFVFDVIDEKNRVLNNEKLNCVVKISVEHLLSVGNVVQVSFVLVLLLKLGHVKRAQQLRIFDGLREVLLTVLGELLHLAFPLALQLHRLAADVLGRGRVQGHRRLGLQVFNGFERFAFAADASFVAGDRGTLTWLHEGGRNLKVLILHRDSSDSTGEPGLQVVLFFLLVDHLTQGGLGISAILDRVGRASQNFVYAVRRLDPRLIVSLRGLRLLLLQQTLQFLLAVVLEVLRNLCLFYLGLHELKLSWLLHNLRGRLHMPLLNKIFGGRIDK